MPRAKAVSSPKKKITRRPSTRRPKSPTVVPQAPVLAPSLAHGHAVHHPGLAAPGSRNRHQRLFMILGVTVVVSLLLVAWILNLKTIINATMASSPKNVANQKDFGKLKEELSATLSDVKGQIGDLKTIANETPTATAIPASDEKVKEALRAAAQQEIKRFPSSSAIPGTLPE